MKPSIRKLISFGMSRSRGMVISAIFVSLIAGATSAALMALINNRIINSDSPGVNFFLAFGGLALVDLAAGLVASLISNQLMHRTNYELRMDLFNKILATPLRKIEEAGNARTIASLTQDIPAITNAFLQVPAFCVCFAIIAGCLIYLSWLSLALLSALVVILILVVISVLMPEAKAGHHLKLARDQFDALVKQIHALIEGAKELKLNRHRRESFLSDILQTTALSLRKHNVDGGLVYAFINSWTQVMYFVVVGVVVFALPPLLGGINSKVLIGYTLTILYLRGPVITLLSVLPVFRNASVSLAKVEEIGLSFSTDAVKGGADACLAPKPSWERLELKGVTHTYYSEQEDNHFMLGPINLAVRPGELVFLVGGNGSGKTTLAKLFTGLYDPESGEIRLDGRPITDESRDEYRQYFSAVFTDFHVFDQLLGFDDPNVDERANKLIEKLQLSHKLQVKHGKLSNVELSFGQRKRLALLTAYLEDRPIFVFDEWAAGQDPYFKELFYLELLPELKAKGKMVLVISHDDQFYHMADRIIRIEFGKIDYDKRLTHDSELMAEVSAT